MNRPVEKIDFDALWNYNDPASTEQAFRTLLPTAEASHDDDYHAQLLTQIARTQALQRQFEAAHQTLDEAEALLSDAVPLALVRYWLERGRTYNSVGRKEDASALFLKAYGLAADLEADFFAVDALHMLAIATESAEAQIAWNEQAIACAEQSAQSKARNWLGSLTNNLGWTYHDMGNYAEALKLFEKALAFRQEQGNEELIQVAQWCVARVLRSLGRVEEAYAQQLALAALGEPSGYTHEELGECLLLLEREAEARPHFAQAHALLAQDPWLVANEPARLQRLQRLAAGK